MNENNQLEAALNGTDLFGEAIVKKASGPVSERFGFPPFTILDSRGGEWQDRKRAWISVGIKSEEGRKGLGDTCVTPLSYFNGGETIGGDSGSIFDPVLCECIYRWFSAPNSQIIDPFAGDSVRGVVAGMLNRRYWGCDLRSEQISANREQAQAIRPAIMPEWVCGDSVDMLDSAPEADLIFSCPPYDDPKDLSTMEYHTFRAAYGRIILKAVSRLKANRFACFVVGDFRSKQGFCRDFVSATVASFKDAGAELYNEAILCTPVGTAMLRVSRQFEAGRKFAKTHQNVLVFL